MPDKDPIVRAIELLKASPVIDKLVARDDNKNLEIHFNVFAPVGGRFPQINVNLVEEESEEKLPAYSAILFFDIYNQRTASEPYKKMKQIDNEIKNIFNRRPTVFNEVDKDTNEGLRVVKCLRMASSPGYEEEGEVYRITTSYRLVVSDNEDYRSNYDGSVLRGDGKDSWP